MIAVSIPCFRVKDKILGVLKSIPAEVSRIYVVDDACPEGTGDWVQKNQKDPRVQVLRHEKNQGVGGATLTGFIAARRDGASILVKLDGDGQMPAELIARLVRPIQNGMADYCKGNRFYAPSQLNSMPWVRLLGNSVLSFVSKVSSGYWRVMDPTNGFLAIHALVFDVLPISSIAKDYFFESDMLCQLNIARAVIQDVPMNSVYADEKSSLRISNVLFTFPLRYFHRFAKRFLYNYVLRDFNIGTAQVIGGKLLFLSGLVFGLTQWLQNSALGRVTPTGTIMLSVMPMIVGFQLILSAMNYDILSEPRIPIHPLLES